MNHIDTKKEGMCIGCAEAAYLECVNDLEPGTLLNNLYYIETGIIHLGDEDTWYPAKFSYEDVSTWYDNTPKEDEVYKEYYKDYCLSDKAESHSLNIKSSGGNRVVPITVPIYWR